MRNVFVELVSTEKYLNGVTDSEIERRINILDLVKKFIDSGVYSNYGKKEVFLQNVNYGDDILAIKLDTSEATVRKIKSRFSQKIYEIIGKDFFDKLRTGTSEELDELDFRVGFANAKTSSDTNFTIEFLNKIRENSLGLGESYDILSCKYELSLLRWLNINRITDLLSGVDLDKINYVLDVMDNKAGTYEDRLLIYKILKMNDMDFFNTYGRDLAKFPPRNPEVVSVDK